MTVLQPFSDFLSKRLNIPVLPSRSGAAAAIQNQSEPETGREHRPSAQHPGAIEVQGQAFQNNPLKRQSLCIKLPAFR